MHTVTSEGRELLTRVEKLIGEHRKRFSAAQKILDQRSQTQMADYFESEMAPVSRELRSGVDALVNHKREKLHLASQEADQAALTANRLIILIAATALVLAGLVAFLIARTISGLYKKLQLSLAEQDRLTHELRRSNEDLEHFASIASHDLREPLRTISTFLGLLERTNQGRLDPSAKEYISFAIDGANRLKLLIDALLEYSHAGHKPMKSERVSCDKVVEQCLSALKTTIAEGQAVIEVGPLPAILGDAVQLGQLFQNLIANALKYRRPEPPHIEISARPHERGWLFSIRDNGIGFGAEDAAKIFDAFQRLHTRSEHAGTGLGLAVCKRIVQRHGGVIWAESKPNEGSVFYFTLPRFEERAEGHSIQSARLESGVDEKTFGANPFSGDSLKPIRHTS